MKAMILGECWDTKYLLEEIGFKVEFHHSIINLPVLDTDLVVFLGGHDVNPKLYGEQNVSSYFTTESVVRDNFEKEVFEQAQKYSVPCFGICRGFQFINVMNNGTLRQHIDYHTGNYGHHLVFDEQGGHSFLVNSYHHQAVNNIKNATDILHSDVPNDDDLIVESAIWTKTISGGVQWHPEWMIEGSPGREYYINTLINKLMEL